MSHKFREAEASIEENRVRDRLFMMYLTLKVDEDDLDSDEQVDEPESVPPEDDVLDRIPPFTPCDRSLAANVEVEGEERRREAFDVRRPGMPEQTLMGLTPQPPPSDHRQCLRASRSTIKTTFLSDPITKSSTS